MSHPIRKAQIHTFERKDHNGKGVKWIAQFHPYKAYPIFFRGKSESEVIQAAEELREEAIDKHEAACLSRQFAREKAAETRRKKEAEK